MRAIRSEVTPGPSGLLYLCYNGPAAGGHDVCYSVTLQNKTKQTPRALAVNWTWSQFMFDGTGCQRGEHRKRIVSNGYATGPVECAPPAQARPVVT